MPLSSAAIVIRPAREDEAPRLASLMLSASRSHLPAGYLDLFFGPPGGTGGADGDDAPLLAFLEGMARSPRRNWGCWRDFLVLEEDGELAAGCCACPASELPPFPVHDETLAELAQAHGWPAHRLAFSRATIARFMDDTEDFPLDEDSGTLFVQFLATRKAFRGRGHATLLLTRVLLAARQAGLTRAALITDWGNREAEGLYHRLGFRKTTTYRYHIPAEQEALLGPGIHAWETALA